MTNLICGGSQQTQSQSAYSVAELSSALQSEAQLDRFSAGAIAEQVAFQSLPREQLQKIVEQQLCEVSDYKIIPMTTRELGLVQSGCRFSDIDAAMVTLLRRLDPHFAEPEPPAQYVSQMLPLPKHSPLTDDATRLPELLLAGVGDPFHIGSLELPVSVDANAVRAAIEAARVSAEQTVALEPTINLAPNADRTVLDFRVPAELFAAAPEAEAETPAVVEMLEEGALATTGTPVSGALKIAAWLALAAAAGFGVTYWLKHRND